MLETGTGVFFMGTPQKQDKSHKTVQPSARALVIPIVVGLVVIVLSIALIFVITLFIGEG